MKINITIPEEDLGKIDEFARSEGKTRSGLFLEAVRLYVERAEEIEVEKKKRLSIQKASSDIKKLREKSCDWDGVAEIRKWRNAR